MVEAPKISKHCLLPVSFSKWAGGKLVLHYIEFPGFHGRLERQGEKFLEHLYECLLGEEPSQLRVTITVTLSVSPWTHMSHMPTQILSEALFSQGCCILLGCTLTQR